MRLRLIGLLAAGGVAGSVGAQSLLGSVPVTSTGPTSTTPVRSFVDGAGAPLVFSSRRATGTDVGVGVTRLDPAGTVLSDRTVGAPLDPAAALADVARDAVGNVYLLTRSSQRSYVSRMAFNGLVLWTVPLVGPDGRPGLGSRLATIDSTGVAVIGSMTNGASALTGVWRLRLDGSLQWRNAADFSLGGTAAPVDLSFGRGVLVGLVQTTAANNANTGTVVRYDLATGVQQWTISLAISGYANSFGARVFAPAGVRTRVAVVGSVATNSVRVVGVNFIDPATGLRVATREFSGAGTGNDSVIDAEAARNSNQIALLMGLNLQQRFAIVNEVTGGVDANGSVPFVLQYRYLALAEGSTAIDFLLFVGQDNQNLWIRRFTPSNGQVSDVSVPFANPPDPLAADFLADGRLHILVSERPAGQPDYGHQSTLFRIRADLRGTSRTQLPTTGPNRTRVIDTSIDAAGNATMLGEAVAFGGVERRAVFLVRQTADGTVRWRVPVATYDGGARLTMAVRSDGSVLVAAGRNGVVSVARYASANGARLWARVVPVPGTSPVLTNVALSPDGDLFATGSTDRPFTDMDAWLARIDGTTGTTEWARAASEPGNVDETGVLLAALPNGGVAATVRVPGFGLRILAYSGTGEFQRWIPVSAQGLTPIALLPDAANRLTLVYQADTGPRNADIFARRFNPNGTSAWPTPVRYNFANRNDFPEAAALDAAGNLWIAGGSETAGAAVQSVLLSVGPTGALRWVRRYSSGPGFADSFLKVAPDGAGRAWVVNQAAGPAFEAPSLMRFDATGTRTNPVLWRSLPGSVSQSLEALRFVSPNRLMTVGAGPFAQRDGAVSLNSIFFLRFSTP